MGVCISGRENETPRKVILGKKCVWTTADICAARVGAMESSESELDDWALALAFRSFSFCAVALFFVLDFFTFGWRF